MTEQLYDLASLNLDLACVHARASEAHWNSVIQLLGEIESQLRQIYILLEADTGLW